jgi:putative ATPase
MNEQSLFALQSDEPTTNAPLKNSPLAYRLAPKHVSDFLGQAELMDNGQVIQRLLVKKKLVSCILWGPPGCGKTSLARLLATNSNAQFSQLNAVTAKIADLKTLINQARQYQQLGKQFVLFIDEIHRFSKTQQDVLLPVVEEGTIYLIGATTENPYFAVIAGLTSRCHVFELQALNSDALELLIKRALEKFHVDISIEDTAKKMLICYANGDGRKLLNGVELALINQTNGLITKTDVEVLLKNSGEAQNDDSHYDLISAYIKSMRNSDPDAALYWLARLLAGGEDPMFIARRIVIFASEDVGNRDPSGLNLAVSCLTAVKYIGMPECRINLSQATTYLAKAKKSNASYSAINKAQSYLKNQETPYRVPTYLRDSHYSAAKKLGYNNEYIYPHNEKDSKANQACWPGNEVFYNPKKDS